MTAWFKTSLIIACCALIGSMIAVWVFVDLGTAGAVASVFGAVAGIGGLIWTVMSGVSGHGPVLSVRRTGKASAAHGGRANSGVILPRGRIGEATAEDTGDAQADGGSANTGIGL